MKERPSPFGAHRRVFAVLALAVVVTVGVVLLIGQATHYADLAKRLRDARPGWLVVCAGGIAVSYLGWVISYREAARVAGGPRLPASLVMRVVGLSFGAFTVASTIGGLTVDFWALREAGEPAAHASARVIAFETLRWALLAAATCAASIAILLGVASHPPWPVAVAWVAGVPPLFAAGLWISAPSRRERFIQAEGRLRKALGIAVQALVYLRLLVTGPRAVRIRATSGCAIYWVGDLLCAWAALRAFGTTLALAPLMVGYTTGYLAEALPLPAGGSGGIEAALTGGFVLAGAPLAGALLGAVAFRVFNFWLPSLPAMASVLTVRGLRERLQQIARERSAPAA